jgi:hypothetical protein
LKARTDAKEPMTGRLEEQMLERLSKVPGETRRTAQEAVLSFRDRPKASGLDEGEIIRKLALFIHEGQYTVTQVTRARDALDQSEMFRPAITRWREQIKKEAERDERQKQQNRKRFQIVPGGLATDPIGGAENRPAPANQLTVEQQQEYMAKLRAVLEKGLK